MIPVKSTSIASIGYSGTTLRIQFKTGKTYDYAKVSRELWSKLIVAPSIGAFFGKEILGKFAHTIVPVK